ncbi:Holliday junction resolvase [Candidatus Woesearchaeota archaeon]|nr:Holliday junction resolvase [Candidatus Woesearchaeota archaeon]
MSKRKGSSAERDLLHKFWAIPSWVAIRAAGSGSMRYPSPDIIAATATKKLLIECKVRRAGRIYLSKEEVLALREFADLFGGIAYVAFKLDRGEWRFVRMPDLEATGTQYVIHDETPSTSFEELVELD